MKQNVLFFIFRLYGGGAERMVSNLSQAFSARHNVKIAIFDDQEKTYPHGGELIRIKLPFSANPVTNPWWARIIRLIVLICKLRRIKKEHKIDISISFAEQANIVNVLSRRKEKTILSVRTLLSKEISHSSKMKVLVSFIRKLYNRAPLIIVPSRVAAHDLTSSFSIKPSLIKVIYNYVDKEKITRLSAIPADDPFTLQLMEQPVLLNVGRITVAKGQWLLLEVMKKIKPLYPDWKLVIIGEAEMEGDCKARLLAMAADLGLKVYDSSTDQLLSLDKVDKDVYFLGFQMNPFWYMRKSKVLVFPSVFEGFPNTVLEAMHCELPVIVADCQSGPREILYPGSGLEEQTDKAIYTEYGVLAPALKEAVVNPVTDSTIVDEWTKSIIHLMNNTQLRQELIRNASLRVNAFDKTAILQQWEDSLTEQ